MNSITAVGNIGKDGEIRYLQDGTPALTFSLADSRGKDKKVIWWSCSIFGKRAESMKKWVTKGRNVTVIGPVDELEYQDKHGETRRSLDIRVNEIHVTFDDNHGEQKVAPAQKPIQRVGNSSGFEDMDNDIPF